LPELELTIIWNDNNILYSNATSIRPYLENSKNNIYTTKIKNIEKNDKRINFGDENPNRRDPDDLTIAFTSWDQIIEDSLYTSEWNSVSFCSMMGIRSDYLCWDKWIVRIYYTSDNVEKTDILYKSMEKIDSKNIKINYNDWTSKNYKIFDLLK